MADRKDIDFVLGTQYGDEGKGMIAKLVADKAAARGEAYTWTGRCGAQNAEHRFVHDACEFCARVFPSASAYRDITAILGAGHCFNPDSFLKEAIHMGVDLKKVKVDPHAMWLKESHATANAEIATQRGTTGWGVGAAVAEKVRRKPGTQLIGECEAMKPYLADVPILLDTFPGRGLMEGSQGALLSLDHGAYPYCTSKNVTAPAICGELGVSTKRVGRVFGVTRLVPMRVPGQSGPTLSKELSYDEIEKRTGLRVPQHRRTQGDAQKSGSMTEERLFEFSLEEMKKSHILNGYDGLAVTFADFHRPGNYRVKKWDDLHSDTRALIEEISHEIAPVFLVRTGQGEHDNIWLADPFTL